MFSLHPQPLIQAPGVEEEGGMSPKMLGVLLWNVAGFTGLYGWLFNIAVRARKLERAVKTANPEK